ncbi:MAG: FtsQ-type POTRA domain-containing protein [Chloroflexi bacterium]|nr:FtsQ-type POTRA domain-containing protein [Chloroflexota bacterium]
MRAAVRPLRQRRRKGNWYWRAKNLSKGIKGKGHFFLSLALCMLFFALMATIYYLPYFKVSKVVVLGTKTLQTQDIWKVANVANRNIFTIDPGQVERIIGQLPPVKEVTVKRVWPDQVVIQIQERQPQAIWQTADTSYLVDNAGVIMGLNPPANSLLSINDTTGQNLRLGSRIDQHALDSAQRLARTMPIELGTAPTGYEYSSSGLKVFTTAGWQVVFGYGEPLDYQIASLKEILRITQERKLSVGYVDLRFRGRPYLRGGA